jgi:hypothetical protein
LESLPTSTFANCSMTAFKKVCHPLRIVNFSSDSEA